MQDRAGADAVHRYGGKRNAERPIFGSLFRGALLKCPACGRGAMFRRYLKVADACPACGEELHHHRADDAPAYFTIVIVGHIVVSLVLAVVGVLMLRRFLFAPFGYAMRAGRDSTLRAEAIGIDVKRVHWLGFAAAGGVCGIAGGLFAFAKGSISPETIHVGRSIDGLVMVLLGGIQTLTGPIVGASVFATLQDTVMRQTEYWRALLGLIILLLVLAFPQGIVGAVSSVWRKAGAKS